eukprot:TRINITY_DN7322_c0_g1_i1.p2 TRINITY_DN7322_c0_g1~~TRINITY_DN7322_c0_g1_i1.p2  ORF type:complete len:108 (+),score=7.94 TRINITY_DN7322_c0_g1_i1:1685-2008(+)
MPARLLEHERHEQQPHLHGCNRQNQQSLRYAYNTVTLLTPVCSNLLSFSSCNLVISAMFLQPDGFSGPYCSYCGKPAGLNGNRIFRRLEFQYCCMDCLKRHRDAIAR